MSNIDHWTKAINTNCYEISTQRPAKVRIIKEKGQWKEQKIQILHEKPLGLEGLKS